MSFHALSDFIIVSGVCDPDRVLGVLYDLDAVGVSDVCLTEVLPGG